MYCACQLHSTYEGHTVRGVRSQPKEQSPHTEPASCALSLKVTLAEGTCRSPRSGARAWCLLVTYRV